MKRHLPFTSRLNGLDESMISENLTFIEPDLTYQDAYRNYCQAFRLAQEPARFLEEMAANDFPAFIQNLKEATLEINLPAGFVPSTMFWLVRPDKTILGQSNLRHHLTPDLNELGGHIGYAVHPLERRKGYGTLILKLTLEKARRLGLKRVLVTCDTVNLGSAKVIMNNGGILDSQLFSLKFGKQISRYWIDLESKE
jgi:predicted acetyltransferase